MNISEYLVKDTLDTDTIVRATVVIDYYLLEPLYKADFYMHLPSDIEDFILSYDDIADYALVKIQSKFKSYFNKIYESLGLPASEEYDNVEHFIEDFINVRCTYLDDEHCVIDHDNTMVLTREGRREFLHLQHKIQYLEKEADMEKQMEQIGSMFGGGLTGKTIGFPPFLGMDFKDDAALRGGIPDKKKK